MPKPIPMLLTHFRRVKLTFGFRERHKNDQSSWAKASALRISRIPLGQALNAPIQKANANFVDLSLSSIEAY